MKYLFLLLISCFFILTSYSQNSIKRNTPDSTKKIQVVETACGECKFGLPGKSCDLAIRIDGKAYFVDGTTIDEHGDAHADDGFCNAIRRAKVQGEIIDNRFKATYFSLLKPNDEKSLKNRKD